jgi:hypothetical protein
LVNDKKLSQGSDRRKWQQVESQFVPNNSGFRKRNRFGNVTSALRFFEIALVLVRLGHGARGIVNANHSMDERLLYIA